MYNVAIRSRAIDSRPDLKMPNRTRYQLLKAVTLIFDVSFISTSILLAYWIRFESGWLQAVAIHKGASPPLDFYFRLIPLKTVVWLLILRQFGLYRVEGKIAVETVLTLLKASGITLLATLGAVFFLYQAYEYSRWVMVLASAISTVLLFFGRVAVCRFKETIQQNGIGINRVAIVGFNPTAHQLIRSIQVQTDCGYTFVGAILGAQEPSDSVPHHILGRSTEMRHLVQEHHIHELFVISPAIPHEEIWRIVGDCEGLSVQINVLPDLYEVMIGRTQVTEFNGIPVVKLKDIPIQGWHGIMKRGMDIMVSIFALAMLSPLMLAVAIVVKFTSSGKVIFQQERIGRDGKPFYIYKFRSMRQDAEKGIGHAWAALDDPRQTQVGGFLRRWGLDELPQFFNVLKGDMSLIGPRPEMSGLVDKFSESVPHYLDRHRVKCGMTGWAQVNGLRGNTSLEERVRYDLYYIENWSIGLDIKILLKTLWAIWEGSK